MRVLIAASLVVALASATKVEHSEPHSHNKVEHHAHDNGKITHGEDSKFHGTTVYTRGFKFGPSSKPTHAPTSASVICEDLPHGAYKRSCDGCELDQEKCLLKCNACVVKADDALLVPQPLTTYSDFDNKITGKYELDMSTCATNHAANKDGVLVCQDRKVLEDLGIKPKIEPDNSAAQMMFLGIMAFFALVLCGCCILSPRKQKAAKQAATPAAAATTVVAEAPAAAAPAAAPPAAAPAMVQPEGEVPENAGMLDDYFYKSKLDKCLVPLCCPGAPRSEVFRDRYKGELRNPKLELHLDHKVVVNLREYPGRPGLSNPESYWYDLFYYIFQKDHFLSCIYADHEHPFTKRERWMVYFTMCTSAFMAATMFRPPSDCHAWTHPKDPGYADLHTWGRQDPFGGFTSLCESGYDYSITNLIAVVTISVLKVCYGMFLEFVAFCPCFVDYVGLFKNRTERIGAIILYAAVLFGFVQLAVAFKVIADSPFKFAMIQAGIQTIICGILTGWITYWGMYQFYRIKETGCKDTFRKCAQSADKDGDGVECKEVCFSIKDAWKAQADMTQAYDDPDDNDDVPATDKQLAKANDGSFL